MANLFQKIGQKLKDAALGTYHQFATNDGGQNYRSYVDEEEKRRREQQAQAAQRAAQQMAQRNAPSQPGSLSVAPSRPAAHLNISQPDTPSVQPKLTVAAPVVTPQIKVPQVTPPKAPLPDQQFKGITESNPKNKTIFGWNAAAILPKGNEKTYTVKADRNLTTNKDKFVAQYDNLNPDYQKVLVNQATQAAAKGDQAAINTIKALTETGRLKGNFNDFMEGANERLGLGLARGALRTVDFALPGHNTFGLEHAADQFDPNKNDTRQITQKGKTGEKFGTVEKGLVDLAAIAIPGGAADKGVEAVQKANQARKLLEVAGKLGMSADEASAIINSGMKLEQSSGKVRQFLTYAAKIAPGSLVGTGIDALETKGRGDKVNVAKSAGIGLATDLATPVLLKPIEKGIRLAGGKILNKVTGKASAAGIDEGVNDLVDHSLTFSNIRDRIRLPGEALTPAERDAIKLAEQNGAELAPKAIDENVRAGAPQLSEAEHTAAQKASDALVAGDDAALKTATDELDRIHMQYETTPVPGAPGASTITREAPTVPRPQTTDASPLGGTITHPAASIDSPKVKVPEQSLTPPPAETAVLPPAEPDVPLPQSLTDRTQVLEERMLTDPTPETQAALTEAHREAAARQAAVVNRSVTATPNQELVNGNLVSGEMSYKPVKDLSVGTDSMDTVDRSAVDQYKEHIANGQPIDPVIVRTDENGVSHIQDGKHRAIAMHEMGIENAPISEQVVKGADPTKQRGFAETIQASDKTAPEVAKALDNTSYTPLTNEESLAQADQIIRQDPEAAITRAKTEQQYGTEVQAVSMRLIDELQAAGRYDDAIDVVTATAARATEAGQASQILAAYNRLTPEGILTAAQREITNAQKLNPEKYANLKITPEQAQNLRTMAEHVAGLAAGSDEKKLATRALLNELSRVVPTPGARKFVTLWKAGLLTGVKGAIAGNTVGNATAGIIRKIADVPAAMIDTVLAQATGHRSKVFTLKGLFGGFGEGLRVGAKNFKEGVGAGDEVVKLDYKKVNFGQGKLGRAAQKYTDSVFNFYSAADRPFYHAALENNLRDLAKVEVKNAGLKGADAAQFIDTVMKEPPDHILTQAVQAAEEATFQGKNALGSALSGAKRGLASKGAAGEVAGEVLMPFTGVPAAIAKQVYDYSPAGAVVSTYKAIRQAADGTFDQAMQRRLTEALGRGITGTGVIWMGSQLHNDGILTLGWPTDPKERALWESEGKTPYSLKIGGKWRSLNYMGSAMSLMAIGGQINEASKNGGDPIGNIASGVASSGKAIIGSTPLQGVQGGLDAVTDPERYGKKFVNNTIGSIVPTIVKDVAVAGDPLQRQTDTPAQAIQSRIPGARNGLPAKVDVFGNDMPRATSAVGSIIDPFKSSTGRDTPITNEMRRLQDAKFGVNPPKIDKTATFDGVDEKLNPAAVTDLTKRTNLKVQEAWQQTIASPEYQALSDEDKSKALANISGDIAAVERRKYAAEKQLGQYKPGFTGTPGKLSGKQNAMLEGGGFDSTNYTSGLGDTKLAKDISSVGKATLVKVGSLTSDKKAEYLKDPKNNYQYKLAQYENDFKNGKLSDVDQYTQLQSLGNLKVKSNYSAAANELYGLSKTKLNDFINKKGGVDQKVLDEVLAMDQQLADEGFISKPKFGGSIAAKGKGGGGGGGGKKEKTINVPHPNFGNFKLVAPPTAPHPTMQSVAADLQRMFGDIKILQGVQIAPGDDSSKIQIAV